MPGCHVLYAHGRALMSVSRQGRCLLQAAGQQCASLSSESTSAWKITRFPWATAVPSPA